MLFFYLQTKDFKNSCPPAVPKDFTSVVHPSDGIKQHSFKGILIYTEDWVWKRCSGTWCCSEFGCSCPPDPGAQHLSLWSMVRLLSPLSQRLAHQKNCGIWVCIKKSNLINIHISHNHNCSTQSSDWVTDILPASVSSLNTVSPHCALSQHCQFQRDVPEGARGFMWRRAVATTAPNQCWFYLWFGKG